MSKTFRHQVAVSTLVVLVGVATTGRLHAAPVSQYNVVWDSPSADCNGSMPIGNGDIGANVWVEDGGDLLFYISKTDAREENDRLVKLGKVRVRLNPNPFAHGGAFKQELDLENGVIRITSATQAPGTSADLRFWIDADHPAIRITGTLSAATEVEVRTEPWRTNRIEAKWEWSFSGLADRSLKGDGFPYPVFIEPDTVVAGRDRSVVWYHRNRKSDHSVWQDTLKVQGLGDFIKQSSDPLLDRTFGALVEGDGLVSTSPTTLKSVAPTKEIDVSVFALTARTPTAQAWVRKVEELAADCRQTARAAAWAAHQKWWNDFWDRSWISIDGKPGDDTFIVSRGYALQNWVTACAGRGNLPISFNGSIFTVDGDFRGTNMGPDYRRWGSCYWFQNTRLPYWPMLAAGHYDQMRPLFKMYLDALPLARHRVRTYYGFAGAVFPETMHFWGAYRNEDYGWHRHYQSAPDEIDGKAIRYYWQGGIELTAMMLQYYQHTLDREFLDSTLLPFAREITAFYDNHYKRDERGKLAIHPANALEDVQDGTNPAPELAGLRSILPSLIELESNAQQKAGYARLLRAVPELPRAKSEDGREYLLPAETGKRRSNCEKPECYALFPYRLYGVGLPDLELARETFRLAPTKMNGVPRVNGWVQDAIFAACVGDAAGAAQRLIARSKLHHEQSRFPAFWGPNFDWVPDQDHGCVNMIALQQMLLQTDPHSNKIRLFPAWPKNWDCSFKLHAPGKTVVQGRVINGKIAGLIVTPEARRQDVVNYLN